MDAIKNIVLKVLNFLANFGLDKLERALLFGGALVLVLALLTGSIEMSQAWFAFLFRWLHVASGVMWIGLLWYFNFVQIPSMPQIPDEQKPAVSKVIAPAALFWFRWAALSTMVTGLILAIFNGYLFSALFLGIGRLGPADLHRHRDVAWSHHGLQRVDDHLAQSAKGAGPSGGRG